MTSGKLDDISDDACRRARERLRAASLRCTDARLAVVALLERRAGPMTCSDASSELGVGQCDPATVYRTLVTLAEHGIARVVGWADGMAHYELSTTDESGHQHAHFHCTCCADVTCLPAGEAPVAFGAADPWRAAVATAQLQLHGVCPGCSGALASV